MSLLPTWRRRQIEHETQYFHALLQSDADGDLVVEDDDWQGGLARLREGIEESNEVHAEALQKALESLKNDFERDLESLRSEIISLLGDLSDDVKYLRQADNETRTRGVAGAVRAVKEIRQASVKFLTPGSKREANDDA
jgi:hypothetical protein